MMLAAAVPQGFSGELADLGAGAGAAGLAVAARCPGARVTLVENHPVMAEHARQSLALEQNRRIAGRARLVVADVTLAGKARGAAGLADRSFDFVIANPPFNRDADRASPDALRRAAHVLPAGQLAAWLRTAAAILRPSGGLALIARPQMLPELFAAMAGRFGAIALRPVHPRADAPAIRIVLRAVRGSRAPLSLLPMLVLHEGKDNRLAGEAASLVNGEAELFAPCAARDGDYM